MASKEYLKELLTKISVNSDQVAAREFFNFFHPRLVRYAVLYTSSIHSANDIVSDVFVKLFKNREKLMEINDIQFYMFRAVKNQCLTYLKKENKTRSLEEADWEESDQVMEIRNPESEFLTKELTLKIEEVINNFPPKRKTIYKMVMVDGMKYKEAAEILDVSIKTIENHLALAVKQMRSEISTYVKANDINLTDFKNYFKNN